MPTEVFNCEYFDELKRKWQAGEVDKAIIRFSLRNLPEGEKILAWLDRPIKIEGHNILTMEKFNE